MKTPFVNHPWKILTTTALVVLLAACGSDSDPTAIVGGSYGPVNAEVSVTLSETFGESITISRQEETSYQTTVNAGDAPVIITLWQLVERFSFTKADGSPYVVPGIQWPELVVDASRASYLAKDPYLGN